MFWAEMAFHISILVCVWILVRGSPRATQLLRVTRRSLLLAGICAAAMLPFGCFWYWHNIVVQEHIRLALEGHYDLSLAERAMTQIGPVADRAIVLAYCATCALVTTGFVWYWRRAENGESGATSNPMSQGFGEHNTQLQEDIGRKETNEANGAPDAR